MLTSTAKPPSFLDVRLDADVFSSLERCFPPERRVPLGFTAWVRFLDAADIIKDQEWALP